VDSGTAYFAMPEFPRGPWRRGDTLELAAVHSAVPQARRRTREMLWEWKLDFLADDAELVVAELASNAIAATHLAGEGGGGDGVVLVGMLGGPSRLLILVRDGVLSPPVPALAGPDADGESGRGLLLVDALAARWHWYHPPRPQAGKVVWALLEGTNMNTCTCGYAPAEPDHLFYHLEEAFGAADDRDSGGVLHAEAARDNSDVRPPYRCLCGHAAADTAGLDRHLLRVFTPADRIGLDGRAHASVPDRL
jgi:hypothetical protein